MRYEASVEQKKFWKMFEELLIENGEPFKINYHMGGEVKYFGAINSYKAWKSKSLVVCYKYRDENLSTGLYIENDVPFYNYLLRNKEDIEKIVGVPFLWGTGIKNPNTRRLDYTVPIIIGDEDSYRAAAEKILVVVMKFFQVAQKYGRREFFDF